MLVLLLISTASILALASIILFGITKLQNLKHKYWVLGWAQGREYEKGNIIKEKGEQ